MVSQSNPTNTTTYQIGASLSLGIGVWDVTFRRWLTITSSSNSVAGNSTLGTSSTSNKIDDAYSGFFTSNEANHQIAAFNAFTFVAASATTLYPQVRRESGVNGVISFETKPDLGKPK